MSLIANWKVIAGGQPKVEDRKKVHKASEPDEVKWLWRELGSDFKELPKEHSVILENFYRSAAEERIQYKFRGKEYEFNGKRLELYDITNNTILLLYRQEGVSS